MLRFLVTFLFAEALLLTCLLTVANILELLPKPLLEASAVFVSFIVFSATVAAFLFLIQELRTN